MRKKSEFWFCEKVYLLLLVLFVYDVCNVETVYYIVNLIWLVCSYVANLFVVFSNAQE